MATEEQAEVSGGALGGLLKTEEVSIPPFLRGVACSFWTTRSLWRWRQCCKAEKRRLGPQWWQGVTTPVLEYSFLVFFCVKEFTTLFGSLLPSSQRQFLTQHWAPIQARHDSPGLLSQLPLVASKSSHCCCFLLLLPPESLRIQGLERQCHVLISKCFHSYRIYNLPACLYPYGSHLTYKLSRNYI